MTPHPTGSHVRLSPSPPPKGEGRKTTRLRVASNRRADWQVVLCARGARASSQGLCPPRLWRHEPQAKYNEEPPAKPVGYFFYAVRGVPRRMIAPPKRHTADGRRHVCPVVSVGVALGEGADRLFRLVSFTNLSCFRMTNARKTCKIYDISFCGLVCKKQYNMAKYF